MSTEMLAAYHPKAVEHAWDAWWAKSGYYSTDARKAAEAGEDGRFVMVIPPPNVTGSLHLGHGLTCAIQDALCRWHRMHGRPVMWLPGTDHAGIATQTVVERRLAKDEGKSRHDLGRTAFVKRVWEWKEQYGGRIVDQLKHLGVSVDWSRERFTMDDGLSAAVTEAFCRMHEKGLIYRDTRLVNWCCALNSAISDIEVDALEIDQPTRRSVPGHDPSKKYEFGTIISFSYRVDESDELVTVATTRLETMLGDAAVAVHPEDARYAHLHGKFVVHPFNGKKLPIVTDDELVDMSFGTGAVKITPAHDPNDFKCGRKHGLPEITILNDDGTMNAECGEFAGMMRYDARVAVLERLKEMGLYVDTKPNKMAISTCSRTGDLIEPMLKPQWWVDCNSMAAKAVKAVREGEMAILPAMHEATWFRWLEDCRDWCISRQLWWGHRIPAYHASVKATSSAAAASSSAGSSEGDAWIVARTREEALGKAAAKLGVSEDEVELRQDEDVLDTWFSSGLFPFSTFGWPAETEDVAGFYPNSLLETGHDILFFWVARMVMMGLELTGRLPFRTVYLHAMVRDKYGRKMSKSLGNVIDPLEVINGCPLSTLLDKLAGGNLPPKEVEKASAGQRKEFPDGIPECGADALRFGLLSYTQQGRDINLNISAVVSHRHFCNKLWNATRFAMANFDGYEHTLPTGTIDGVLAAACLAEGGSTLSDDVPEDADAATDGDVAAASASASASSASVPAIARTVASRPGYTPAVGTTGPITAPAPSADGVSLKLAPRDRWILSRLNAACRAVEAAFRGFAFAEACAAAHHFWLEDLCDVYLELAKPVFRGDDADAILAARVVLYTCLDKGLRMLHPMMPFVTEELWQRLPGRGKVAWAAGVEDPESIMIAPFPRPVEGMDNSLLEAQMTTTLAVVKGIRTVRTQAALRHGDKTDVVVATRDADAQATLEMLKDDVQTLGAGADVSIVSAAGFAAPAGFGVEVVDDVTVVYVKLAGLVDAAKELKRLNASLAKKDTALSALEKRMATAGWERSPEETQLKDTETCTKLTNEISALRRAIEVMESLKEE
jgi:valyl-tRNA synthetase